ncbi:molybdopterin-guanine dinucleotide biosynthesis protein B [Neobacillus sp.]|uniref:molybdopterin-guanine dinucleotide biosynthesis protein B n=1 Tax=Neobacillus sp. TaxID=2675273 RepID=UPI0028A29AAA|nr:molybdopterin-guanine dinucleotide biosynthesis protein B [Neobacillus sp.]
MALVKPVIFQVVGYQNSGKTTLTFKLIEVLKKNGLKTVTIKHHGHGAKPDVVDQKDSTKHLSAGAAASIVEGGGRLVLQADDREYCLEEQIELMKFFQPDVILIEGYKQKSYPKLLLLRDKNDFDLLNTVNNITAVVYWKEDMKDGLIAKWKVPSFHISDESAINWAFQILEKTIHKTDDKI